MSALPPDLDEKRVEQPQINRDGFPYNPSHPPPPAVAERRLPCGDPVELTPRRVRISGLSSVENKTSLWCAESNQPAPPGGPTQYSRTETCTLCAKSSENSLRCRKNKVEATDVAYLTLATAADETGEAEGVEFDRRHHQRRVGSKILFRQPPATGSYYKLTPVEATDSFMFFVRTKGGVAPGRYQQYYVHLKEGGRYNLQLFSSASDARITRLYIRRYDGQQWQVEQLPLPPVEDKPLITDSDWDEMLGD